ncbi:UbiA family prenyltransferase [Sphingomonas sp. So64.6b]|uniref:UbiA family prenyltransferase n=1 Tax=Sphingomonas sp. So64.6b TaxID=2997354 RepID=UPI0015FEEF54|nr:UbiA family prenyltransferase [Sphingomonas sp. So64.6b]QNA83646.1 UbiA family prenyltransferase [Sphingomonas sp. So64.6b]
MNAPVTGLKAPVGRPLYVDLDRTLISADVSLENWLNFAKRGIVPALLLCWWLLRGRAYAKSMVARRVRLDPATLPYREEVLEIVRAARADGRRVVLASGSHQRHVTRVARHLGLFDNAVGSVARRNLKGRTKLAWINADADGPFDYVGDSRADRPIWSSAHEGLTVGYDPRQRHVRSVTLRRVPIWRATLKAMRPHQWAKNALIGVPLATSGLWFEPLATLKTGLAFLLFSLTASGVYLINDLLDIESDRAHRVKFSRPIASGTLPIPIAIGLGLALLTLPLLAAALTLGLAFAAVMATYLVVTTAYSLRLKQAMTLDVVVLACLYTIRIFAGGVAIEVAVSSWLLTFAVFFFLSLAYLKRYTELAVTTQPPHRLLSGRGYVGSDIEIVMMSGVASGMVSILVLALFIKSASPAYQGGTPELLWGLCLVLLYWLNRVWMMARRGQVSGDPIAFAITDRRSLILGAIALVIALAAQRLSLP